MPARKHRPGKYGTPDYADAAVTELLREIFAGNPFPDESIFYDYIDPETGDITINGATMIAGLDF